MGLDSVELVMEFENFFNIRIPDPEAEKLTTVGEVVDYICGRLAIQDPGTEMLNALFQKMKQGVAYTFHDVNRMTPRSNVSAFCNPSDEVEWQLMEQIVGMALPNPGWSAGLPVELPAYEDQAYKTRGLASFEGLIVATLAHNLDPLENPVVKNRLQVHAAVVRITVDKIGVDYFEAVPAASFTNDLGVD